VARRRLPGGSVVCCFQMFCNICCCRVTGEQLEHVVDKTSKLAVTDLAEECGVRSNPEERIPVCPLDDCDGGFSKAV
jgi:hypothetical protein